MRWSGIEVGKLEVTKEPKNEALFFFATVPQPLQKSQTLQLPKSRSAPKWTQTSTS